MKKLSLTDWLKQRSKHFGEKQTKKHSLKQRNLHVFLCIETNERSFIVAICASIFETLQQKDLNEIYILRGKLALI